MRRKHVAGRDAVATVGGVQQQHPLLIYIGEAAVQADTFEANLDRLAEPGHPRAPRLSHRAETLLPPASRPSFKIPAEGFEHRGRLWRAMGFGDA